MILNRYGGRLDGILDAKKVMIAADLGNTVTNEANHNSRPWPKLLEPFGSLRNVTSHRLQNLRDEDAFSGFPPPPFKTLIRIVDLFTFVAEHDDHTWRQ